MQSGLEWHVSLLNVHGLRLEPPLMLQYIALQHRSPPDTAPRKLRSTVRLVEINPRFSPGT